MNESYTDLYIVGVDAIHRPENGQMWASVPTPEVFDLVIDFLTYAKQTWQNVIVEVD